MSGGHVLLPLDPLGPWPWIDANCAADGGAGGRATVKLSDSWWRKPGASAKIGAGKEHGG